MINPGLHNAFVCYDTLIFPPYNVVFFLALLFWKDQVVSYILYFSDHFI